MKRIVWLLTLALLSLILLGCLNETVDEEKIDLIDAAINAQLPREINHDFLLPDHLEASIEWRLHDQVLDSFFIYEPPLFDQEIELHATIKPHEGGSRTVTYPIRLLAPESGRHRYVLEIEMAATIPDINRNDYVHAAITLSGRVNGVHTELFETHNAELRGRGNSTWFMPKKPFRIRLGDEASLLGLPKARNYVLLAEYADKSLMRNTVVHWFTHFFDHLDHAISTRYVEVYVNGNYEGVYVLTEHVEVHPNKLTLNAPSDEDGLDVGYFMELDQRFYEHGHVTGTDWFIVAGVPYNIKNPSSNNVATMQAYNTYIRDYVVAMEAALQARSGYEAYIDVDNFIDYFIIQELFKNVDIGWSSVFMHKQPGEPLRMGPIWDFDLAIGNAYYMDFGYGPEGFHGMRNKNRWFTLMMQIPEVRSRFRTRYAEVHNAFVPILLEAIPVMTESLADMAANNFNRWPILTHYVWPNPNELVALHTHQQQAYFLADYIQTRSTWMYFTVHSNDFTHGFFD